jgi:ADP-ribose pyrophosphatase
MVNTMAEIWPKVRSRKTSRLSNWVEIIEREVEFETGGAVQVYHAVQQADYIAIVALTPQRLIPIVRQYRPALESFTWELPAGLVEEHEDPAEACRRELLEETGLPALAVHLLGTGAPCTGRLSNRIHSFFVETGERIGSFVPEPGVTSELVSPAELAKLALAGEFVSQLHLGALLLAQLHSFLELPI